MTPDGTARVVYADMAGNVDELYLLPGGAPNMAGFGARPAVSEQPQSASVPTGASHPAAASADQEGLPAGAQSVAATAPQAARIHHVWNDGADPLFTGPWTDGLALNAWS